MSGNIVLEKVDRTLVLTIANERKRNAVDRRMERQFIESLEMADHDDDVRTVVITGAGDVAFCSGHDLSEIGQGSTHDVVEYESLSHPARMRKPVVAAVNGHCHAAGLVLALSCDLRIASENTVFGQPGAKLGMLPVGGQMWRLPRLIPETHALEMMLTSDPLPASDAYELGLLNRLVPAGEALAAAMTLAARISENSPAAVQAIKGGFRVAATGDQAQFASYESRMSAELMSGPDAREGVLAFREKRRPQF